MAHKVVTKELERDGQCTPWGFRMSGGADIGTALMIQRVCMGSPSDGELQKGDFILSIGEQDARKLSHQKASDIIAKTGNKLRLVVARSTGPPPPMSPAMSPTPGNPVTVYHLNSQPTNSGMGPLYTGHGNPDLFKPLPKTEFHNDSRNATAQHQYQVNERQNANDEKAAITSQAYRTLPLITPTLKSSKDCPVGSYLRFSSDTSGRSTGQQQNYTTNNVGHRQENPFMLTKVQEAMLDRALSSPRASVSSSRTSTPDIGYQNIFHRQYNSPINMYSNQSIVETLSAHTTASNKPLAENRRVQSPCKSPVVDLSKSPTYQLIHEQEWKDMEKKNLEEHEPVPNQMYSTEEPPRSGYEYDGSISQSGSFKVLMSNMKSVAGV